MWFPHPSEIIRLFGAGSGSMGDVEDETSVARWPVVEIRATAARIVIVGLLVRFIGGSGTADLAIRVDSKQGEEFDFTLFTLKDVGQGADAFLRVRPEETPNWIFDNGDEIVLEWANPDTGVTKWAAELRVADASDRPNQ